MNSVHLQHKNKYTFPSTWTGHTTLVRTHKFIDTFSAPQQQMIREHGYPEETHTVRTADGYILTVHRIPYSPVESRADLKPVALLLHGLLGSSAQWVTAGPQKGLGNSDRQSEIYYTSIHVYYKEGQLFCRYLE
jgi:hypothetical protein